MTDVCVVSIGKDACIWDIDGEEVSWPVNGLAGSVSEKFANF
jgi:hypothetical protein